MKKRTYIFIILLIFFFLITVTIVSFLYFSLSSPPQVSANSYLDIRLAGELQEKAVLDPITSLFLGTSTLSMHDIWTNFQKAKIDNRINCIVLRLNYLACNWAKVKEIRDLILDFKKSGKKVYAYIDEALEMDKEYYLATACDKIIMHPEGIMIINGIGGYIPFVKNALEKLGIEAEVEHVEEYKTAYHMFIQDAMTPAHREMLESIYSDLFSHYVNEVAKARGKTPEEFKSLIDHGFFQGKRAIDEGLVDDLLYEDEFQKMLKEGKTRIGRISHEQYTKIKPSSLGLNRGKKLLLFMEWAR